ncbi:hypothetical protein BC830DRAFT_833797 [Chytriomyces sp. MP71]|nr:hypothetical protein BC830DRAFT_833797 [Chytriomyces sp. MP71]
MMCTVHTFVVGHFCLFGVQICPEMLAKSQSSTVILITIALVWTWIWVLWSSFVTKESDYGVESSRNDPPKRTPPLLVHASAMFDGMLHLQYSYSDGLIGMPPSINASLAESRSFACPSPRSALIGILTTAQPANTARRNALRHIYSQFQRTSNSSVDIVYFFGSASDDARNHQLSLEKSIYDDIVVTSRKEARDYGKILDWFEYARDHAYTWVPTDAANPSFGSKGKGIWCRKYNFIAKGDDDSIIHIPRLEKLLGTLNMSTSHFVGASFQDVTQFEREFVEGMHGMLYLVSSEIAEWIRHSPIPLTHVVGVEDQQVALWLKMSKIAFNRVGVKVSQFHDFEGTDAIYGGRAVDDYKHRATPETIVLHNCKYLTTFYTCMSEILER